MSFTDRFAKTYKKLLPAPFTIALLLTALTFILALILTKPEDVGLGAYALELTVNWEEGLWNPGGGGLYFAFQMMLMLVLGHILALSKPASHLIDRLTTPCTTSANTAAIVTAATIAVSLFNWGLGLIFGAILARKVGEKFNREQKPLNYPLIGAAAYSGLMVWHGGISGSAPIKAHEEGNLQSLVTGVEGVDVQNIPSTVEMSDLIFSTMNIVVSILLIVGIPAMMYWLGKRRPSEGVLPKVMKSTDIIPGSESGSHDNITNTQLSTEPIEGAEKLDHSKIFSVGIGSLLLFYAIYKALILPEEISLKFLTPNYINFVLLGMGLIFHYKITNFLKAAEDAISGATGILLQFPLYFGILGLMVSSGLINQISDWFVSISNETTFPLYTFFSAGLVNIFVPSGGGQWAVQGPILISSVQELGLPFGKSIMALSYGDQLTNMIQPFWALPLLGITGLKAKEILPYTLYLFLGGLVIFILGLLLF